MSISRRQYIEQIRRQIYGGQPSSDAEITVNLVNQWLNQAVAFAAKQNYTDNLKLEGVAYINNGFYSTFKGLSVSKDENFLWKVILPEMPVGLGTSDGVSTVVFKDSTGKISYPVVMMSESQKSFQRGMRDIPNKLLGYQEGNNIYVLSTILLSQYTVSATIVSAGLSTDLDSAMNVPTDYIPVISEYLQKQFMLQRNVVVDEKADGIDNGGKTL
jgi:hypothetical protein